MFPKISVIVATYNRSEVLRKSLKGMRDQAYPSDYEIIVVDDGSTDNTKEVLEEYSEKFQKVKFFSQENKGPAAARNLGIKKSKYPLVAVMDDDCIPDKNWLRKLVENYQSGENIGVVLSFSYGGTSTLYTKEALKESGLFDETYKTSYREDTDLAFRVLDKGFKKVFAEDIGKFIEHLHKQPKSLTGKIRYGLNRCKIHMFDNLLYKKHPKRAKDFLDIKFGVIRNPLKDFKTAIGLWKSGKDKNISLSSPQGVSLIKNKTFFHELLIILLGIAYTFLVAFARLWGSFKFKKFLV